MRIFFSPICSIYTTFDGELMHWMQYAFFLSAKLRGDQSLVLQTMYSLLKQKLICTIFHASDEWVCCVIVFGIIFAMRSRLRKSDRMHTRTTINRCWRQSVCMNNMIKSRHESLLLFHLQHRLMHTDAPLFRTFQIGTSTAASLQPNRLQCNAVQAKCARRPCSPLRQHYRQTITTQTQILTFGFTNFEGIKHCQCHYRH